MKNANSGGQLTNNDGFFVESNPIAFEHKIYITDTLVNPTEMINAISVLDTCSENDVVHVYINTGGGNADSGMMLYNSLQTTKALTIAHCSGTVASAGTMIMMGCDQIKLARNTALMFHSVSSGYVGKAHEVKDYSDHLVAYNDSVCRSIYGELFTDDEYDKILSGKDHWMTETEFLKRYAKANPSEEDLANIFDENVTEATLKKLSKETLIKIILGEVGYNVDTGKFE